MNQLDTISKQVAEIHKQLSLIQENVSSGDNSKTILYIIAAGAPLLVGFVVFILNRNKERHSKKSELCGEIFARMFELQRITHENTLINIKLKGYLRILKILEEEEKEYAERGTRPDPYDDELPKEDYIKLYNNAKKEFEENAPIHKEITYYMAKSIGQFRLYLSYKKRKEFDLHSKGVIRMRFIDYAFTDVPTVSLVESEMRTKFDILKSALRERYSSNMDNLQMLIDKYTTTDFFWKLFISFSSFFRRCYQNLQKKNLQHPS